MFVCAITRLAAHSFGLQPKDVQLVKFSEVLFYDRWYCSLLLGDSSLCSWYSERPIRLQHRTGYQPCTFTILQRKIQYLGISLHANGGMFSANGLVSLNQDITVWGRESEPLAHACIKPLPLPPFLFTFSPYNELSSFWQ